MELFYIKVKKFCFLVNFFIWIIKKKLLMLYINLKKKYIYLECFEFEFFEKSEKNREEMKCLPNSPVLLLLL
jgi:hypothetical protein